MYKGSFLLSFYAETPVHMGAGSSVSYVDLPVQRERHTSFPVLWGSGIKGVLRNFAYRKWLEEYEKQEDNKNNIDKNIVCEKVNTIFGPEDGGEEYSSCISITDAKILLYPVRSVRGVFAWITCPFVLKRFLEDLKAIKKDINISDITILDESKIIISKDSKLKIENQNKVALEEFVFNTEEKELNNLISFFEKVFPQNNPFKEDLEKHLAIVSDNVFKDFVNYAVEIRTRIRIDQAKGTVKEKALFSEELIPSESIFYSLVFISEPKKNNINFEEVKKLLTQSLFKEDPLIQFGGDETTGKGFFRVKLFDNK
jgi:CRISPR-associated protein Cmr4